MLLQRKINLIYFPNCEKNIYQPCKEELKYIARYMQINIESKHW